MNIAIVGSGPSAFYTTQSLLREDQDIKIDIFEKLPAPFGLVRYGVAPDHQKTKNIIRLFSKYLDEENVAYFGNVNIGKDVSIELISQLYDAVIISSGASLDKELILEGDNYKNLFGSAEFVGWYNGNPLHSKLNPNFRTKNAVIIGNGNVALDCARILSKSKEELYQSDIMDYALDTLSTSSIENIYIIGRRTPKEAKFTISELREMGELKTFEPKVNYNKEDLEKILNSGELDTKVKKNIEVLLSFKSNQKKYKKKIIFKFLSSPYKIVSKNDQTHILLKKSVVKNNNIVVTNEVENIEAGIVISAIGYKVCPIDGLELDPTKNFFANKNGHIKNNIYTNGWASGASVGVIGTNKIGASLLTKKVLNEVKSKKPYASEKIKEFLKQKLIKFITKDDWKKLDKIEIDLAKENFTRAKLADLKTIFKYL